MGGKTKREELFEVEIVKRCHGKLCYPRKGIARYKAAVSNKIERHTVEIEPYKCAFGRHWHIGHHPKVLMDRETLRQLKNPLLAV